MTRLGEFFKVLWTKFVTKINKNVWLHFWAILKIGTFWKTFWRNYATFYSTSGHTHHCADGLSGLALTKQEILSFLCENPESEPIKLEASCKV